MTLPTPAELAELKALRYGEPATVKAAYLQTVALVSIAASLEKIAAHADGFAYPLGRAEDAAILAEAVDLSSKVDVAIADFEETELARARVDGLEALRRSEAAKPKKKGKGKKPKLADVLAAKLAEHDADEAKKDALLDGARSEFLDGVDDEDGSDDDGKPADFDGSDADGEDFPIR